MSTATVRNPPDAISLAQAHIASILRDSRGTRCAPGASIMPWFVYRAGIKRSRRNFGDELNYDLGAALVDRLPRCSVASTHLRRPPCAHRVLNVTNDAEHRGKVLALGSVVEFARTGDVVYGAGVKPHGSDSSFSWLSRGANNLSAVKMLGVRGPRTCDVLHRLHVMQTTCPSADSFTGDPGLFVGLLAPSWAPLRWNASPPDAPGVLCVAPHVDDVLALGSAAGRASERAAFALQACLGLPPPTRAEVTKWGYLDDWIARLPTIWQRANAETRHTCQRHTQIRVLNLELPPRESPAAIGRRISTQCDLVASTALHAIIAADALMVPAVWLGEHRGSSLIDAAFSAPTASPHASSSSPPPAGRSHSWHARVCAQQGSHRQCPYLSLRVCTLITVSVCRMWSAGTRRPRLDERTFIQIS